MRRQHMTIERLTTDVQSEQRFASVTDNLWHDPESPRGAILGMAFIGFGVAFGILFVIAMCVLFG